MRRVPIHAFIAKALCLVIAVFAATDARAAVRVGMNGEWQFKVDANRSGAAQGWMNRLPEVTDTVGVPHTWNIGKYDDYEGAAWYFKTFQLPLDVANQRVELHFGATFYKANVWINGVKLGEHEGGHSAYHFDITPHLRATNFIAVEINNQPGVDTIPALAMKLIDSKNLWYDWWHYGGIVRDVDLRITPKTLLRRQQIRSDVNLANLTARISNRIFLENHADAPVRARLTMRVFGATGGAPIITETKDVTLRAGSQSESVNADLRNAQLWHFDDPQLYRCEVELTDAQGAPLDSVSDNFGLRKVEVKNRGLYLNGERVRLTGMTRHETSPWEGLAETRGSIRYDYDDLKRLNVTLTRPVHYQQHPEVLDYADRNGILFIPEIPMWQFDEGQMSNPKVIALAERMMREMIEQNFNHPSIFAWSACNESATDTPGGIAYFRRMKALINSLDPDRYVTFADEAFKETKTASADADFMMVNQYYGSWHGPNDLLPGALARINRTYPNKMVIISEFGLAGLFGRNPKEADELRSRLLREQLAEFAKHDWIGGAIMWCYQDYKSHRNLSTGYTTAYVDFGVVDEYRQRRPGYELWQDENSPVRVNLAWERNKDRNPIGFRATLDRRRLTELPSYTPRNYRVEWEVRNDDGELVGRGERQMTIDATQTVAESFQLKAPTKSLRLIVRALRPTGFVAAEENLEWLRSGNGGEFIEDMRRKGTLPNPFPPRK